MSIGIVGLGYVGLPLAMEFAEAGMDVIGVDLDAAKVAGAARGPVAHRGRPGRAPGGRAGALPRSRTRFVELHEADAILDLRFPPR